MLRTETSVRRYIDQIVRGTAHATAPVDDDSPIVAIVAMVLMLIPCVLWIFQSQIVWPWDQAYYAELSLKIRHAAAEGVVAWLRAFLTVPDSRAPLLVWLAQATTPFMDVLGAPERALLLTNIIASGATLWLVFSITRRFGGSLGAALAGMLVCGGATSFIAFNHQFLAETLQITTIAGTAWIAFRAHRLPTLRLLSGVVIWAALAMLAKTTSLGYIAPFLVYIVIVCIVMRGSPRSAAKLSDYGLAFVAILLVAAAAAWYVMHWTLIIRHVLEASKGDIALLYGSNDSLPIKLLYWSHALLCTLSPYPLLAGLILLIGAIGPGLAIARQINHPVANRLRTAVESGVLFLLCLAGTIVASLVGYSNMINQDPRLLSPMIPIVALLFSWSLAAIARPRLSACAVILLTFNWLAVQLGTLGIIVLPWSPLSEWLEPPRVDIQSIELMTRAVHASCDRSRANHVSIIGAELPQFSAVSAWLYAEKMRGELGYRCEYWSLGYAEQNVGRAIKWLYDSNADFFLTLPLDKLPSPESDPFNRVARPVATWIASSPDFERITPEGDALIIYRRRQ